MAWGMKNVLFGGGLDAGLDAERDFAREFYRRHGRPCLDLYALMAPTPRKYVLPEDEIHRHAAGHELFARELGARVDGLLSKGKG